MRNKRTRTQEKKEILGQQKQRKPIRQGKQERKRESNKKRKTYKRRRGMMTQIKQN